MTNFFRKIKLIQFFSIGIPMDRIDFVKLCRKNIERKEDSTLSMYLEYFTRGKHKYIGSVEHSGLKIRKRKTFFSFSKNACLIDGFFKEKEQKLFLETEIKGYSNGRIIIYLFIVFWFLSFVVYNLFQSSEPLFSILSGLFIQTLFLLGIPYLIIKLRIKGMKVEFQKDLYSWILK